MVKTFQNVALFLEETVLDNVLIGGSDAARYSARTRARQDLLLSASACCPSRIKSPRICLSLNVRASRSPAALCTEPKIPLLDEAMAALNHTEMDDFMNLVRTLRSEGLTIVIIEHHMRAIMSLCDRIIVLNFGKDYRGRRSRRGRPASGSGCRLPWKVLRRGARRHDNTSASDQEFLRRI